MDREGASDSDEQEKNADGRGERGNLKLNQEHKRSRPELNKIRFKRNRRKEVKRNKNLSENVKIVGINAAGIMTKLDSFENLLRSENPAIFCIQETKAKKENKIKTEYLNKFTIFELVRKKSNGGGLCIGVLKDLQPCWISSGNDEIEYLTVEVWVANLSIRIITAYGPQIGDSLERKENFWEAIEKEAKNADMAGAGVIIQMDSNCHFGKNIIKNDCNDQNQNGKLFEDFMTRNPSLNLINSLDICEGTITRMRKTTVGVEKSALDVFITCNKIKPFIKKMKIDEKRENILTNFGAVKQIGRVVESDHNLLILELGLEFSKIKPDRAEIFQFKSKTAQDIFRKLTNATKQLSECFFRSNEDFEVQAETWRKKLNDIFHKAFKKVRITNKQPKKLNEVGDLIEKRKKLKNKTKLNGLKKKRRL